MKLERGMKAFITGAASGIGRATALAGAQRGLKLFLTDIDAEGLAETRRRVEARGAEVGRDRAMNITDYAAVRALADELHAEFGPMELVMNVAGVAMFAQVEDMAHADWKRVIDINLWGPIHVIESFVPEMIKAGRGHLVNVSSTAGLIGLPWHGAYSTSKHGLVGVSEVLRYDLRRHHVGVTVICPGAVDTPLKERVDIVGVRMDSPGVKKTKARFDKIAVSPERVAELIFNAIERERFLVITSFDIKVLYFLKRTCHPLYHLIMILLARFMIKMRDPTVPGRRDA